MRDRKGQKMQESLIRVGCCTARDVLVLHSSVPILNVASLREGIIDISRDGSNNLR